MSVLLPVSSLTGRSANEHVALEHRIQKLPILVLSPHSHCNCRCVMCDIWKIREVREITADDLRTQLASFGELGIEWVVFSGGEALLHTHLSLLAKLLREEGMRLTLLTTGLLLERQAEMVATYFDDVIVSLDGPPAVHDRVRRVQRAFTQLAHGVRALRERKPAFPSTARCTIQKLNHHSLVATARAAQEIGLDSISFLAVDAVSEAFNRPRGWEQDRQRAILLSEKEVEVLAAEVEQLIVEYHAGRANSFVAETPKKLRRIVHQFRAALCQGEAVSPRCNAPWVSAVIEATGEVRPCFFHSPVGNIHEASLAEIINGPRALAFRQSLDIATNPICRRCVCSLYRPQENRSARAS